MIRLVNAVGGGDLSEDLDLYYLMNVLEWEYKSFEPESYAALVGRITEGGATIMLFSNGKYNIAGASSVEELLRTHRALVRQLESGTGKTFDESEDNFEIRNLVYIGQIGTEVGLESLLEYFGEDHCELDRVKTPALLYRKPNQPGVFQIFRTGNITYTGHNHPGEAEKVFESVLTELKDLVNLK